MAVKTFGEIIFHSTCDKWIITSLQPHVCIRLKNNFPRIEKSRSVPFEFHNTPEICHELLWFLDRYPLIITDDSFNKLSCGRIEYQSTVQKIESILSPAYHAKEINLIEPHKARDYQLKVPVLHEMQKRLLLGDDVGLGKTLSGILTLFNPNARPGIIVVQTHLPLQWKNEGIEKFTNLKVHVIKQTKLYDLPEADVYIIKYSFLAKWVDFFNTGFFKSVIFDEIQELRITGSQKYNAAEVLSENAEYCMGMSATPIYNYGDEIYNVLNLIKPGCLGPFYDFIREWASSYGQHFKVNDPAALGTYLRENYLFLRRTTKEVGRELPPINKIVTTVEFDDTEAQKSKEITKILALKVITGSFVERGSAARELNALLRHETGVGKAIAVASLVKLLLENGEPVLLAGWHRDVYEIWLKELEEFKPVMYTGSESPKQKEDAKRAFIAGETNLFIISLRSGIGLDGLQHRCRTVVVGELDWSPQVHLQLISRVARDGNDEQVTAYYPVCDYGSDPIMIDILGLKSSQAFGITDPLSNPTETDSDDTKIKMLAERWLEKNFNVKDMFKNKE